MNATPGLLSVQGVGYRYETSDWELAGLSFEARAGEILAIIGPNGSGKSTLLRIAAGILSPREGGVRLEGRDMEALPRRDVARVLGYLPQQVQSAFDYSVEEAVSMGRFPHLAGLGFLRPEDARIVESAMRRTETLEYRARSLSRLSGGERQRVFLASVLAQEPRVLLLDEPTSALDIHHQARFFRLLRELGATGIAVAVVTHDLNIASLYCDRLLLLSKGRAVCEGNADDVLRQGTLEEVYGESVHVDRDSRTGRPIVLPGLPGGTP